MVSELRKTGISVVGDVPWGAHVCYFYETKHDLLDTLVPYFKAGLESNEFCLWIISKSELVTAEEAEQALRQAVPDLDRFLAERRIEIVTQQWFLKAGGFDRHEVARGFKEKLNEALARGLAGMRINGSPAWLQSLSARELLEFEEELHRLIPNERMIASCTYPLAAITSDQVFDIVRTHQYAIARRHGKWEVIETPELIHAKAEIARLNEALLRFREKVTTRPSFLSYGVSVLSVTGALVTTLWLQTQLGQSSTPIVATLLCAIMFSAWFGGVGPGLLAIALSILAFDYYFVTPLHSFAVGIKEIPRVIVFVVSALVVGLLSAAQKNTAESLRRARDVLAETVQGVRNSNQALRAEITERKQAEEALKESQRRLEEAQRIAHVGHWERDLQTGLITWSDEIYRIFGLPRQGDDAQRTEWLDLLHPEDLERVSRHIKEAQRGSQRYDVEYRILRPDGEVSFVHSQGDIIRDERGQPVRAFGIAQDITERKRAEETLKQSENQLAEAQHLANIGSWSLDLSSNTVTWSDELYRIYGVQPSEFDHRYEAVVRTTHPEDRESLRNIIEDSIKTHESFSVYYRINKPAGDTRILHARGAVVTDEHGNASRLHGTAQDVTDRKRAEEALREAEQKYRDIFENAGEGIFQSTTDGRYIAANPALARMYGFASTEELIHSRRDISRQVYVDPTRREEFKQQLEEQGAVLGFEHEVFRKDGSTLWISVNARVVRDEQGAIRYYEGTVQDVTERKGAEEKLKSSSEQLRALSARLQSAREEEGTRIAREIHDELGSSLTSLKWDLEEMDKILATSGGQLQIAALREKMRAPMKLADTAISSIRRIASELRPSVLDDLGLVAAIEWQAQQFQARTGIVCVCECSVEKVELSEEESTAVFRILQETLTNVLRHARATKVEIKIEKENGYFILSISDNGKGITNSEKSEQRSLGILGMRERAHLIGADIDINGIEGKGTVVTVSVPISGQHRVLKMTR